MGGETQGVAIRGETTVPRLLRLAPADLAAIRRHCRAAAPAEACGLLVGRGNGVLSVRRIVPAPNLLAATAGRFELDPAVRLAVEKACRDGPDRILGHWHSHPGGRPAPSATDLSMAWEPTLAWLILAIASDGQVSERAWFPDPTIPRFLPLALARRKNPCNRPPFPT